MNERKLTKAELKKREDIVMDMKKNKRELVKRYGKDAEAVMYGRATKLAKQQAETMDKDKIREMIQDALQNPKKADLNKDGKLSDYEEKRGAAIEKAMMKEDWGSSDQSIMNSSVHKALGNPTEFPGLSKLLDVVEDNVDFYMDDFEEYSTDKGSLIHNAAHSYLRQYFPEFYKNMMKMFQPIDEGEDVNEMFSAMMAAAMTAAQKQKEKNKAKTNQEQLPKNYNYRTGKFNEAFLSGRRYITDGIETLTYSLGYPDVYKFFDDNPGALTAVQDWAETVPEFRDMLKDADLNEDLDLGHIDNEPHMLKGDLYRIGKYAMELYKMVDGFEYKGEVDFPHWWQSKIIKAKDALVGAKHYLDFEIKEPEIDAMVDVAQDVEAIDEAVGKFVVRPCSAKDTPWAVWQTSEGGENDKRIKGFKTKEEAQKFADKKNSLDENLSSKLAEKLAKQLKTK